MGNVWFTSDHHFHHAGILKHCPDRPWADVQEMNEALIKNYQEVVRPSDTVYIIGDFAFKDHVKILRRLPGEKHLIIGNHDWDKTARMSQKRREELIAGGMASIRDCYFLRIRNGISDGKHQWIWLAHYAHLSWPRMWKDSWHLYGHSHGKIPDRGNLSADIGVDCWGYYPVCYGQLKKHFKGRTNEPNPPTT